MNTDNMLMTIDMPKSIGGKFKLKSTSIPGDQKQHIKIITKYINENPNIAYKPDFTIDNFNELKDKALDGINLESMAELQIPAEIEESLIAAVSEFNLKLKEVVPQNLSQTLFGIDERDPSDFEKSKFIRAMRIIYNPNHIFELLESNTISALEVDILKEFYPMFYETLTGSVLEVIAGLEGKKNTQLSPDQNRALALILGIPRVKPSILEQKEEEPTKEEIDLASAEETEVQSVLNK